MTNLDPWDFLDEESQTLVLRYRKPAAEIRAIRRAVTGFDRPMRRPWDRAIGSWGGVRTLAEIAELVEKDRSQVESYANALRLRTATERHRRTHAELAALLWCDRIRPARESCRKHGVTWFERTLLCNALEELLRREGLAIETLLGLRLDDVETMWSKHGFAIARPVLTLKEQIARANRDPRRHQ